MEKQHSQENQGYEKTDAHVGKLIVVGLISVLTLAAILIVLDQGFFAMKEKQIYSSVLKPESIGLRELRAREDEILTSYKMLNADSARYQIPIERAMQLLAEESFENNRTK